LPEVVVEGANIVFEERGKGGPAILLHGWNSSRREWLHNLKALSPRVRAIAPDLPGFGESEEIVDFSYSLENLAQFLEAFRRKLRLQAFDLVGHSMGGCIAIQYASRFPDSVRKLVLVSTPTRISSLPVSARMPGVSRFISATYRFRGEALLKWMFYHGLHKPEYQDLDFVRANVQAISRTSKGALTGSALMFKKMDLRDNLSILKHPTLIVFGDKDRTVKTKEVIVQQGSLPHPYVAIITGSGHSPNYERPQIFNELLLDFLLDESL
jgi:pimeloyl-ACP methyl ester carboxylesterase